MNEPLLPASKFCEAFHAWAEACMTILPTDNDHRKEWRKAFHEHWEFIRLAIAKSCLLDRLIYGGEKMRTEMCPVHKGHWSGCSLPEEECKCSHGPCVTGWIRNPDDPKSASSGIAVVRVKM